MSAAGFAGSDITLTFSADFRQARQQYDAFKSEVERQPVSLRFNTPGASPGASSGPGGYVPPPAGPSAANPFTSAASPAAATASAFISPGGGFTAQGNSFANATAAATGASPAGVAPMPVQAARAAVASPALPVANFYPVAQPANVQAATQAVAAVPVAARAARGAAAGGGRTKPWHAQQVMPMGLFFNLTFGGMEVAGAMRAGSTGELSAAFADTTDQMLSAQMQAVEGQSGGMFGGIAALGMDAFDRMNRWEHGATGRAGEYVGVGPQAQRERTMAAQFGTRSTARTREMNTETAIQNVRRGGMTGGAFGGRMADIEAGRLSANQRITTEQENISYQEGLIQKLNIPESDRNAALSFARNRRTALDRRRGEVDALAAFEAQQARLDLADDVAGFDDTADVARGRRSTGEVRRRALVRRHARTIGNEDQDRLEGAELSAFDAAETYRTGERLRAAREEKGYAELELNRQFLTADAQELFDAGARRVREARREGTPEEARVLQQTLQVQLQSFRRNLIDSGTAEFVENPGKMDFSGTSMNRQDDTAAAMQRIEELLGRVVGALEEE